MWSGKPSTHVDCKPVESEITQLYQRALNVPSLYFVFAIDRSCHHFFAIEHAHGPSVFFAPGVLNHHRSAVYDSVHMREAPKQKQRPVSQKPGSVIEVKQHRVCTSPYSIPLPFAIPSRILHMSQDSVPRAVALNQTILQQLALQHVRRPSVKEVASRGHVCGSCAVCGYCRLFSISSGRN